MPEVPAIAIQCPSCNRRFRVKKAALESRGKQAVKCPGCGGAIPIPSEEVQPQAGRRRMTELGLPGVSRPKENSDDELRDLLRKARHKKRDHSNEHHVAKVRRPPAPVSEPDTQPDVELPEGSDASIEATLPVGRLAHRAEDLRDAREAGPPPAVPAAPHPRPRVDTPRAGARMTSMGRRHEPDEPTYTGPAPGRRPKITPTEKDLGRFLVPGNYLVRVEDVVYAPVPHETVAELVDAGVMLGVNEIAAEDGVWTVIVAGGPLGGLRERLSHRAHHMLARVATGRPAQEYGRPTLEALGETSDASVNGAVAAAANAPAEPAPPAKSSPSPGSAARQIDPTEAMHVVEPGPDAPKKTSRWIAGILVALFFAATAFAAVVVLAPDYVTSALVKLGLQQEVVEPPPEVAAAVTTASPAVEAPEPPDPTPAFQSALAAVTSAVELADTIDGLLVNARESGNEDLVTTLSWMKWLRSPEGVDSSELVARLMKRGDYKEARQIANWLIATQGENEELRAIVAESVQKQFAEETVVEVKPKQFRQFVRVDTGHRPALVLEDSDAQRWVFWPNLGRDGWRGDIAVYRLCQLMVCHFAVPETRAATIDKKAWGEILKRSPEEVAEMAKKLRNDFDWSKKGVLTGSLRRLPTGAPWPIEATGIWRPWVTAGAGTSKLNDPAARAHHEVAFFGAERAIAELEGLNARMLARQVADILLVDYLVGNWNRFAPNEEDWGTRTYVDNGLIFSVDDSAAFLSEDSVRVLGRFSWASRFSRTTIDSLRNLDPEQVEPLLFPEPSAAEKEKLAALWSQRRKALRRIDQLVKKYGADDVFALDAPKTPTKP